MPGFGYSPYGFPHELPSRRSGWLAFLSLVNFGLILLGAWLLIWSSEDWWLSMPLVYLPKAPLAIPAGILLLWSLGVRSKWGWVNGASLMVVLGPMMGLTFPFDRVPNGPLLPRPDDLRVVSCNIQGFQPRFPTVVAEVQRYVPDLVAFQEVRGEDHPLLAKVFADWYVARFDYYWVAAKFPVRLVQPLESEAFDRVVGILVEVELPTGPILVANIHLMTARRSLAELTVKGLFDGEDRGLIEEHQLLREREMQDVRSQIDDLRLGLPLIVLGDFNTPTSSTLFRRWWSDMTSSFDVAGWGYGYTSPCRQHRYWFPNTPWVRIDHILCSSDWTVVQSEVGEEDGSDHRLIAATLRRETPLPELPLSPAQSVDGSVPEE